MILTKKKIAIILILIGISSLPLKLYTVEFSLPVQFDNLGYTLDAIQYSKGDFFIPAKKNPGWPLFISFFMLLFNSDEFIDYSNLVRVLSLGISTFTIFPMYMLSRKFFDQKYSIVAVILLSFEPHLNYISAQGLSEPLFILMYIVSFYFILSNNLKYSFFAFLFAGIAWWVRLEGFILFFIITIIFFANHRKTLHASRNYAIGILVFSLIITPIFVQRYVQFDDPFYITYGQSIFVDNYGMVFAKNIQNEDRTAFSYIAEKGLGSFVYKFIITGVVNILIGLSNISYPYLFILIPFGILFSFRAFDQNKKYIRANWIFILAIIGMLVIPFSVINERRFLFPLFPFLIIFATIPIQRLIEYGLSTFSFSRKKKNIFLAVIISIVIILSSLFAVGVDKYGYGKIDLEKEQEKIAYARFLVNELDGRMFAEDGTAEYTRNIQITEDSNTFKNFKAKIEKDPHPDVYVPGTWTQISVYGESVENLVSNGEEFGLKYIAIPEDGAYYMPFLDDVYENEGKYPYLIKVFDSYEKGFKKFKVKVFEIDYEKFHELINEKIKAQ